MKEGIIRDFLWRHLSRESSTGNFIPVIDGLRFIAIGSVILYHLNGYVLAKTGRAAEAGWLSGLFKKGFFGVPLFFVISGFIICHPFARRLLAGEKLLSLRKYYLRRLSRLEPPYFLNLLLIFALLVIARGESVTELWPHLAASLVYLHNVVFGGHSLINGVAWSLEVECQFYILAPLLVMVFRIRAPILRRFLLVAAILGLSLLSHLVFAGKPRLELSVLNYGNYFLTGFLLADFYISNWHEQPQTSRVWDLVSLGAWLAMAALLYVDWGVLLLPLVILAAYCAAFRGPWSQWFFSRPLVYIIGGMCYTIYLYHFFVISAVGRIGLALLPGGLPLTGYLLAMILLVVPLVLMVCAVLFALTERPFMHKDWHRRGWK